MVKNKLLSVKNRHLARVLAITFDASGIGETVPIDSLDKGILNGSIT